MNDKTIELLNRLAEKFGTTVEHLWGVLLKQAVLQAWAEITMAIFFAVAWGWAFKFVKRKTAVPPKTEANQYPDADWEEEAALIAWITLACLAVFVVAQIYCATTTGITALINPEYWALKQVLK